MMMEIGKDIKSCRSEVIRTADFIRFTADSAKNLTGENINLVKDYLINIIKKKGGK